MSLLTTVIIIFILMLCSKNYEAIFGLKIKVPKFLKFKPKYKFKSFGVIDPIEIVSLHNEKREKLFDENPKATFMYQLQWKDKLANDAALVAKQCQCNPLSLLENNRYDFNEKVDFLENVSKQGMILDCSIKEEKFEDLIRNWFDERQFLMPGKRNTLQKFAKNNRFVQIASGENYAVGCSDVICNNKKQLRHSYVCVYEKGVFPDDVIYETQDTRKHECNTGYSTEYPKLCLHEISQIKKLANQLNTLKLLTKDKDDYVKVEVPQEIYSYVD